MAEILGKTKRDYNASGYKNFIFLAPLYASIFKKRTTSETVAETEARNLAEIEKEKEAGTATKKWLLYAGIGVGIIVLGIVGYVLIKK
jgi:hypothetical protein